MSNPWNKYRIKMAGSGKTATELAKSYKKTQKGGKVVVKNQRGGLLIDIELEHADLTNDSIKFLTNIIDYFNRNKDDEQIPMFFNNLSINHIGKNNYGKDAYDISSTGTKSTLYPNDCTLDKINSYIMYLNESIKKYPDISVSKIIKAIEIIISYINQPDNSDKEDSYNELIKYLKTGKIKTLISYFEQLKNKQFITFGID